MKAQDMEFVFGKDLNFDTELMIRKYLIQYNFKPEDRVNKEMFLELFQNLGITQPQKMKKFIEAMNKQGLQNLRIAKKNIENQQANAIANNAEIKDPSYV